MMIEAYSWRVSNKQQVCNWVAPVTSASWTSSMDLATMKKQVAWSSTQVLLILDCWKIISFGLPTIWDNPYLAKIQMKLDHVGPIKNDLEKVAPNAIQISVPQLIPMDELRKSGAKWSLCFSQGMFLFPGVFIPNGLICTALDNVAVTNIPSNKHCRTNALLLLTCCKISLLEGCQEVEAWFPTAWEPMSILFEEIVSQLEWRILAVRTTRLGYLLTGEQPPETSA